MLALRTPRGLVVGKQVARARTFDRELHALRTWVPALGDDASQLLHADAAYRVLVLTTVPGTLAQGTSAALDPDVHRQAGALTARLHSSAPPLVDERWGEHLLARFDQWTDRGARLDTGLDPTDVAQARTLVADSVEIGPVELVPAHSDNSPRNWLVDADGRVRLIDFGHCEPAPWVVDLQRIDRPDLRAAFLRGLDRSLTPHDEAVVAAYSVVAAYTTVIWSVEHRDSAFAAAGRTALARLLSP